MGPATPTDETGATTCLTSVERDTRVCSGNQRGSLARRHSTFKALASNQISKLRKSEPYRNENIQGEGIQEDRPIELREVQLEPREGQIGR